MPPTIEIRGVGLKKRKKFRGKGKYGVVSVNTHLDFTDIVTVEENIRKKTVPYLTVRSKN